MSWLLIVVACSIIAQLTTVIYVVSNFRKLVGSIIGDVKDQRTEFCSLLKHSVDTIKAKSLAERVLVETEEKRSDIQLEMLKDAFEQERETGVRVDPIYARTDAGKEINIREYEIL